MAVKKKSEKREKPVESIHVRLDNPTAIRKENLSLAIEIIGLLKRYYEYLEIKKQKDDLVRLLRSDIAEIKRLARELDTEEMPVSVGELRGMKVIEKHESAEQKEEMPEPEQEKKKEEIKPAKAPLPKKKEPVKLQPKDKLETELEELRNMISQM